MKKTLILTLSVLLSTTPTLAQVTIGSGNVPNKGTLLDLKEYEDAMAKAGITYQVLSLSIS